MPKVITYKELNHYLRPLIGDEEITDVVYTYVGKEERVKLKFKSDPEEIRIRRTFRFKCKDCSNEWEEPGTPVNLNCPSCSSENVEALGLQERKERG